MSEHFINSTEKNLAQWLKEGHVCRKLDANGVVFIEYAPPETSWMLAEGETYLYIFKCGVQLVDMVYLQSKL